MFRTRFNPLIVAMCIAVALLVGCRRGTTSDASSTEKSSKADVADAKRHQGIATPASKENLSTGSDGAVLKLEGLTMVIPPGWGHASVKTGQFSPKTVFALPKAEGDKSDGSVEITHFPGMKGMDKQNIQRWIASVTHGDGSPYTRETANLKVTKLGLVRLTTVDMSGTVRTSMFGAKGGLPDHRMIAAIVDHPGGPHFIKAVAGANTMAKWGQSVQAFLHSAASSGG